MTLPAWFSPLSGVSIPNDFSRIWQYSSRSSTAFSLSSRISVEQRTLICQSATYTQHRPVYCLLGERFKAEQHHELLMQRRRARIHSNLAENRVFCGRSFNRF